MAHLRLLLAVLLLCLLTLLPDSAAGGSPNPTPTPTPWPQQFHAKLLMEYKGNLSLADLWYDWPRGRNLHVIRYQLAADAPYYDAEWNNGTSFFYTPARRTCRSAAVGVGILRPDWLTPGAAYLGRASAGGFDCHVWTKADFITYYQDVASGRPVKWIFYTGRTAHVMSFEPGAVLEGEEWQAPAYCFTDGTTKNTLISEPGGFDDESFIPKIRLLRG
ncbi:hypothetical protein QYE76_059985 [Lolium multiflorum]|uniref:Uncharacterized protein n=1 Tax=Lolium multiflorum TaxID=4521 RepID=A0AAD8S0D2_LOLMU|nr:hypothetical protein QYE76_059985 [Lolium multiflorum]